MRAPSNIADDVRWTCPVCEGPLAHDSQSDSCPRCELTFAHPTFVLDGRERTEALPLGLGVLAFLFGLLAVSPPTVGPTVIAPAVLSAMCIFSAVITRRRAARLVLTHDELMIVRGGRVSRRAGWAMFMGAKLSEGRSLARYGEVAQSKFVLAFESAFKPTISSFLHARGTNDPTFAFPLIFEFEEDADRAAAIRSFLRTTIDGEAWNRRVVPRLSVRKPDPAQLFRMHACLICGYSLTGHPSHGTCPECGWKYEEGMFLLDGVSVSQARMKSFGVLGLIVIVCIIAAAGAWQTALACFVVLMLCAWGPSVMREHLRFDLETRAIASKHGLEFWSLGSRRRIIPWRSIGEFRARQLDSGQWRLTGWDRTDRALAAIVSHRGGNPFMLADLSFDLILRTPRDASIMIAEELERRIGLNRITAAVENRGELAP